MTTLLPAIQVETRPNPQFAVIWMHGLGADGNDFAPVVPYLKLPGHLGVRFIFPHAPSMPVTCNGGYVMPAWYDILRIDALSRSVDEAGIARSREAIRAWVTHEKLRGIPARNIVLAGFSQGGAMAYTAGLTHPETLAGIIALSAYLPAPGMLTEDALAENRNTPVFAAHGTEDDVVAPAYGVMARDFLLERNVAVEWHTYPIPHSVNEPELAEIGRWLTERFVVSKAAA